MHNNNCFTCIFFSIFSGRKLFNAMNQCVCVTHTHTQREREREIATCKVGETWIFISLEHFGWSKLEIYSLFFLMFFLCRCPLQARNILSATCSYLTFTLITYCLLDRTLIYQVKDKEWLWHGMQIQPSEYKPVLLRHHKKIADENIQATFLEKICIIYQKSKILFAVENLHS